MLPPSSYQYFKNQVPSFTAQEKENLWKESTQLFLPASWSQLVGQKPERCAHVQEVEGFVLKKVMWKSSYMDISEWHTPPTSPLTESGVIHSQTDLWSWACQKVSQPDFLALPADVWRRISQGGQLTMKCSH